MIITTPQLSWARTGIRFTLASATATLFLALPGAGIANAQSAAGSQYTVTTPATTVTAPSTTATTPSATTTTPDTGVADQGGDTSTGDGQGDASDSGSDDSGSNNGGSTSGPGSTGAAGTAAGGTAAGAPGAVQLPNRIDYAAFGTTDRKVRDDIRAALTQGNLLYRYMATTDAKIVSFLDGSLAKQLSGDGARAVGNRVAQEFTGTSTLAPTIFRAIFGTKFAYRPFTAVVLSRGDKVSASQVAFIRGLATGFGAEPIPVVYAERSDDKRPHTDEFENIPGVGVVDDIDTAAGKAELVRLLTQSGTVASGGSGGSEFNAQNQSAIANVGDDSSSSMPLILLALVVLGGVVFTGGTLVRRRR